LVYAKVEVLLILSNSSPCKLHLPFSCSTPAFSSANEHK